MQGDANGIPAPTAACIDAETLAAWADGSLSKTEAAAVETHLADCERCTAMVATFARTIPETPAAESLWTRWQLRWLVPLATAATVAALWVLVPRPDSPQITTLGRDTAAEPPAPAARALPPQENTPLPAPPADTKEQEKRLATREDSFRATPPLGDARQDSPDNAGRQQAPPALNDAITVAPPSTRETDRAEAKTADAQTERFSPTPPSPDAALAAPPAAPAAAGAARARAGTSTLRSAVAIAEIASPDPMFRWRVIGTGQVERSTTGGARWEPAALPESATLTAGSSPSPSVCWLVGRSGSIYVTTDGLRFMRVPFSERTDFVSIQATDARTATVVTIDGRRMRTDDQGATWIRLTP